MIDGERHATATERRPELADAGRALGHGVITDELLTWEEKADEFLLMGLRLAEGIDPGASRALAGRALDPRRIADLLRRRRLETCPTARSGHAAGFPVLDAVVADLAA